MAGQNQVSNLKAIAAAISAALFGAAAQASPAALIATAGPAPIELHALYKDGYGFDAARNALEAQSLTGAAVLYDFEGASADSLLPASWGRTVSHGVEAYTACGDACAGLAGGWISAAASHGALGTRLAAVNAAVNAGMDYANDIDRHAKPDHWLAADTAATSLAGDCEDYALAKFWTLAAAGVPAEAMQILLVRDHIARADHAYLLVNTNAGPKLLDNRTNAVLTPDQLDAIVPVAAIGVHGAWLYGRPRGSA